MVRTFVAAMTCPTLPVPPGACQLVAILTGVQRREGIRLRFRIGERQPDPLAGAQAKPAPTTRIPAGCKRYRRRRERQATPLAPGDDADAGTELDRGFSSRIGKG